MYRRHLGIGRSRMKTAALLKTLKERIFQEKERISPVYIHSCEQKPSAEDFAAVRDWDILGPAQGIGGEEKRYLLRCEVPRKPLGKGKSPLLLVRTGARDIWNNNNPQFYAFINGEFAAGLDTNHHHIPLPAFDEKEGAVTDTVDLYLYTNSGKPDVFLEISRAVLDEAVKDLYFDLQVPLEIIGLLPPEDPGLYRLAEVLDEAVRLLDLRDLESESFRESIRRSRAFLKENIYAEGAFAPSGVLLNAVGSTHIDVAWLWTLAQTREKVIRSAATALSLMDQYPEYLFLLSQPQLYQFLKEDAPALYEKVRARIAEGRWEAEGGSWVEPDCNLPSGESFVRQFYYGKRFFKEEFGVDSEVFWVPDTFGYSPVLPQLLRKSGIKYFVSSKISWNDTNLFPYDTFEWQGIDGSRVLTYFLPTAAYVKYPTPDSVKHINTTYNGRMTANQTMGSWQRYLAKPINREIFQCYGYGDGGGGPTAEMLETQRRLGHNLPSVPKVKPSFAKAYLEDLEARLKASGRELPYWVGEIPLEFHRGTLTTMALIKKLNRKAEFALLNTEFLAACDRLMRGEKAERPDLESSWKTLLKNQFHDILPGSSIEAVYPESEKDYRGVLASCEKISRETLAALSEDTEIPEDGVLVYNPHAFELPKGYAQSLNNAETVPPLGRALLTKEQKPSDEVLRFDPETLEAENKFFIIRFDASGRILSLRDKEARRELIPEGKKANNLLLLEDRPLEYEAWNTERYADDTIYEIEADEPLRLAEENERFLRLSFSARFGRSEIRQVITIYRERRLIEFVSEADWHEDRLFLKTDFPLALQSETGQCDIQFGNISRNLHENTSWDQAHFEVLAHHWADISEGAYGASVINDCKYAYKLRQGLIRLSLLRAPKAPNPMADMGRHRFRYALYPHQGHWRDSRLIEEAEVFNRPCLEIPVKKQPGKLPASFSLLELSERGIFCSAVKPAESGEAALIVRLYESLGSTIRCEMKVHEKISGLSLCDLAEVPVDDLPLKEGRTELNFTPYEVKTLKLDLA